MDGRDRYLDNRRARYHEQKDDINLLRREAYQQDPEKVLKRNRAWAECNPEKVRAYSHQYYIEHREIIIERTKRYQRSNRETVNRGRMRRYYNDAAHWRMKSRIYRKNRETRKNGLVVDFTMEDWLRALTYFNNRCAVCGCEPDDNRLIAMDHWIPISYEGLDNPGTVAHNIVPLCHGLNGCNQSKGARQPSEWLMEKVGVAADSKLLEIHRYFEYVKSLKEEQA